MTRRLVMFGPNADGPSTGRIATGFDSAAPTFSQAIPANFEPLAPLDRPDPVGTLLGAPKPATVKESLAAVTRMLMDVAAAEPGRDALLREWLDLSVRVELFIAAGKEKRRGQLRLQIAELTPLCRASLDRLGELRVERGGLESQVHLLEELRAKANSNLRTAIDSRPDDDTFPTDGELAAWNKSVEKATAAVAREAEQQTKLQEHIERHDAKVRSETARLAELKRRREDCRAELEGRQRRGPFGLQIPGA
jgi:hypothetical protein